MTDAALIVCERTGDWALAWRAAFATPGAERSETVIEARSLDECRDLLDDRPASLVVIEITATNQQAACEFLAAMERRWPRATSCVVINAEARAEAELSLRELGAQRVLSSRYELAGALAMVRRHFVRVATASATATL